MRPASAITSSSACERGVLGEEAVAGMDRIGAARACGGEDVVDDEVALRRRRRADRVRVVGDQHVQGRAVGLGVDGDTLDAELAAGARDADRDLAAIGDQHAAQRLRLRHGYYGSPRALRARSEEHTSELQSLAYLVCRLLLEK